jgi:hypothetical protein
MSDYCGWCGKKLAIAEQNDMPAMVREAPVNKKYELNYTLCYNCRDVAKREGWKRKDE